MHSSIRGAACAGLLFAASLPWSGCAASGGDESDELSRAMDAASIAAADGRCPGIVVRTRADVEAARDCVEIDGDLVFRETDFTELTDDDFPQLRRITGSLLVHGANALERVVLPALVEVGTQGRADLMQFSFELTSLRSIELPALTTVHGDLIVGVLDVLSELRLPQLAQVDGVLGLIALPALRTLELPASARAGERLKLDHLCQLSERELSGLIAGAEGRAELRAIGCCGESGLACEANSCGACDRE